MLIQRFLLLVCLAVFLAAMAAAPITAYGYSVVEDDVEVRLDYPLEMKIGTCSTITFWMKASHNLTDVTVVLTVYYHADSAANPVYSNTIVSESFVEAGWTKSKSIQICVPSGAADPYVRAELELRYKLNDTEKRLDYEWYMAIVRSLTYDELESKVESLQKSVNDLEDEVNQLQAQLDEKKQELDDLRSNYEALLSNYSSLLEKYHQIKLDFKALSEEYDELSDAYKSLEDRNQATIIDLEKLRTKYELLSKSYSDLEERYRSLLSDYESTLSELNTYKTMYLDLKSRHEDLLLRHNDLIAEAARLKQRISDLEEDYGALSQVYQSTLGESVLTKNLLFAQTAAVAAGLGIYALVSKKFLKKGRETVSQAPKEENSGKKVQKILSGRRITIPSEVASKLGLKEGDRVEIDYGNGEIVIKPLKEEQSSSGQSEGGGNGNQ